LSNSFWLHFCIIFLAYIWCLKYFIPLFCGNYCANFHSNRLSLDSHANILRKSLHTASVCILPKVSIFKYKKFPILQTASLIYVIMDTYLWFTILGSKYPCWTQLDLIMLGYNIARMSCHTGPPRLHSQKKLMHKRAWAFLLYIRKFYELLISVYNLLVKNILYLKKEYLHEQ